MRKLPKIILDELVRAFGEKLLSAGFLGIEPGLPPLEVNILIEYEENTIRFRPAAKDHRMHVSWCVADKVFDPGVQVCMKDGKDPKLIFEGTYENFPLTVEVFLKGGEL